MARLVSRKNPPPPPDPAFIDDEPTEIGPGLFGEGEDALPEEDFDPALLEDFPEERTHPGFSVGDMFEDSKVESGVVIDPRTQVTGRFSASRAAPDVAQGPWRERAFIPRGVVPKDQIVTSMQEAQQIAAMQRGALDRVRIALRAELMPHLRQAVEQAGGDGLDAWLSVLIAPPGRTAKEPLLSALAGHMARFNQAKTQETLLAEVKELTATVKKALFAPAAKRLSLKALEDEFEGRIEVDALLGICFAGDEELEHQRDQVERTLDSLRVQLRGMVGAPEGLMWNFSRIKVEKRVIEAEQKRRSA